MKEEVKIYENVIPEEVLDPFGRKEVPEADESKTFSNALKDCGGEPKVKGNVAPARKYLVKLYKETKMRIVATMRNGCFDCQTGEEINPECIQCNLGNLEEFFDIDEYGYLYKKDYSAIFLINKDKWEKIQELVS